jgi:cytochrome P450 enzyme
MLQSSQADARSKTEFSPTAPGFDEDPYPTYARLRARPIHYWEESHCWLVTRQPDILAVLRDDRFTPDRSAWEFASAEGRPAIPEFDELNKNGLFALSSEAHARVRRLVSPSLTPRMVERLRPQIQRIVDETIDAAQGNDVFDVVHDFAEHIPVRVISEMLYIPNEHDKGFQSFADGVVKGLFAMALTSEQIQQTRKRVRDGMALVSELIEERRKAPIEGDILTSLIQTEEQGDRLSRGELVSLVAALLVGGSETTVHLIAFSVLQMLKRPEVLAEVVAEPELWKGLMDEVLRFDNFGKLGIVRYALVDTEIAGVPIRKGQMVILMLSAALRDESTYPAADRLDPRRDTASSLVFGNGAHYCIGANLARIEGQIAVSTLFRKFPEMKLLEPPTFTPHPSIRKMDSFKVKLGPARG